MGSIGNNIRHKGSYIRTSHESYMNMLENHLEKIFVQQDDPV